MKVDIRITQDTPGNTSVPRDVILERAGDHLQGVVQWSGNPSWCENVVEHHHKAEGLIEVLEVLDCGSVGGFDGGQRPARTLFDRWDWLYRKYGNPEGEMFACGTISYEELREFFQGKTYD